MQISFKRIVCLVWFAAMCALSRSALAKNEIELKVRHKINASQEVMVLMELKNVGVKPITIFRGELPWELSWAMLFVVVDSMGAPLEQVYPLIQTSWDDEITIMPGARLSGERLLDYAIPSLAKVRKRRNLIVLWTYKPSGVGRGISQLERVSGNFELNAAARSPQQ